MPDCLAVIGAPSSAGAYAPGQEKAPAALRAAGLLDLLSARTSEQSDRVLVDDRGDVPGFRWRVDRAHPRAMNAGPVAAVASATAERVAAALAGGAAVLVLGGDCTVGLGTVAGALVGTDSVGLVYVDLDADLNTPQSTTDGALDWMGVAHLLGLQGTVPALAGLGPRVPLLGPDQILFLGTQNVTPFERRVIVELGIAEVPLAEVASDPTGAGQGVADGWGRQFERLLVHLDLDVLDFLDMPLAEERRRNVGLRFEHLLMALRPLVFAPNWVGLTVAELNPDHGESDGSTVRTFAEALAEMLGARPRVD
jgi:arginase